MSISMRCGGKITAAAVRRKQSRRGELGVGKMEFVIQEHDPAGRDFNSDAHLGLDDDCAGWQALAARIAISSGKKIYCSATTRRFGRAVPSDSAAPAPGGKTGATRRKACKNSAFRAGTRVASP